MVCWNCEKGGCPVNKCSQSKDKEKIAANKKKFSEQKGTNGGSKTSSNNNSHNYNQNKWGASKNGNSMKLFRNKLMCWCGKKDYHWNTTHTTNFYGAYKQNPTTFCLLDTHSYMKSLHNSNETPPDMAATSLTSETYQTVSTMTSTGTSSSNTNDILCIKHSVAMAGLNKLETQPMN